MSLGVGLRTKVWLRDNCICWLCSRAIEWCDMTIDHVKPRSKGGTNALSNLRAAHFACNNARGDREPGENPGERYDHPRQPPNIRQEREGRNPIWDAMPAELRDYITKRRAQVLLPRGKHGRLP